MTYAELFHALFHIRRALQGLAALTGDDTAADIAAALDAIADTSWRALLREGRA